MNPSAKFELRFVGKPLTRLDSICFELDGVPTPGQVKVLKTRAKRDDNEISWCPSVKALALVLVKYRLVGLKFKNAGTGGTNYFFHEPIESQRHLEILWEAVNSPNIIDDICGLDDEDHHNCKTVFFPHEPNTGRTFEIIDTVLPSSNVHIEWDHWKSETELGLQDLLEQLEGYFKSDRRNKHAQQSDSSMLKFSEAVRGAEARMHRFSLNRLIDLNRQGSAARIRHGRDDIFMTPPLGIISAMVENKTNLEDIAAHTSLKSNVVANELIHLHKRVSINRGLYQLNHEKLDCIIFDWTDTLVDEYYLDEALCQFIPKDVSPEMTAANDAQFTHLLNKLEAERSRLWYDYIYLGSLFGKSESDLRSETERNRDKIRALCDIPELVKSLRSKGVRTVLATNCHRTILEWRSRLLGVSLRDFDLVVTSDQVDDVRDKRDHFNLVMSKLKITPANTAMVSDDLQKDLVPAKELGLKTVWVLADRPHPDHKFNDDSRPRPPRGIYGSPTLPADHNLLYISRQNITEPVADYCVPNADRVMRLLAKSAPGR